jgi:hypothetical protein
MMVANSALMMALPCAGLAYHHASKDVLTQAVEDAVSCTHVHPLGIEGAVVQAAAVAWLSNVTLAAPSGAQPQAQPPKQPRIQVDEPRRDAGSSADQQDGLHSGDDGQLVLQPHEVAPRLLQHLQWFSSSTDMQERLATLQAAAEAPAMVQWQAQQWQEWAAGGKQPASAETLLAFFKGYLHSPAWEQELSLALSLTPPSFDGFQVRMERASCVVCKVGLRVDGSGACWCRQILYMWWCAAMRLVTATAPVSCTETELYSRKVPRARL